jgi:hypothetical protein
MIAKQPTSRSQKSATRDAVQLVHIDSELCWCDPIVECDEIGQEQVTHNEVTWN